ncbi:endonuclease domain-containing protein [Asticcacaulis sp.]|uniref:endonuclease domain-containing protein n=1 Tax=Asticcacaulis sp. TaxID=1872648 RepID=UPI003F7C43EE
MRVRDKAKLAFARKLRREMTPPEARIWARLRVRDTGISFRRQYPIGPYVLDFYCAKARLAIEVDGLIHTIADHPERDERRDAWFLELGIVTYRIAASEIMADPDEVAFGIWLLAKERAGI